MKNILPGYLSISLIALLTILSGNALAQQTAQEMDIHSGHFAREGNNTSAAKETNNNIYIKLYPEQWVAILYVPYPYASSVTPEMIDGVFEKVDRKSETGAFTRSKFDILDQAATVHVEKYEMVEGQLQFQCGSLNPCAIRFYDNYIELVKSGIINEHLIKFDHVTK